MDNIKFIFGVQGMIAVIIAAIMPIVIMFSDDNNTGRLLAFTLILAVYGFSSIIIAAYVEAQSKIRGDK